MTLRVFCFDIYFDSEDKYMSIDILSISEVDTDLHRSLFGLHIQKDAGDNMSIIFKLFYLNFIDKEF